MANVRLTDVVASFEAWLITNWPDATVAFVPMAAEVRRPFTPNASGPQVTAQWISYEPRTRRAGEDWNVFDLRLIVDVASNDRLRSSDIADDLRDLVRNAVVEVVDRADGATLVGWVRVNEVGITPPQKDARGKVVSVVDVEGWAESA